MSFDEPSLAVTAPDDITEHERSPTEHAFYESFLLQSRSDVENLYASNIYCSQKHAKEVKDLNRQKMVFMSSMGKEQKEMVKRMQKVQEKKDQIMEVKMKQYLDAKVKGGRRLRPHSTSAVPNESRIRPDPPRTRSGSMTFLDPLDGQSTLSRFSHLSKSSQNLGESPQLDVNQSGLSSRSCDDLTRTPDKLLLPAIGASSSSTENREDLTFITRMTQPTNQSKTGKTKQNMLSPVAFNPERRGRSVPNTDRQKADPTRWSGGWAKIKPEETTHAKRVPKATRIPQGARCRSLPPI